jgi:Sortase domain
VKARRSFARWLFAASAYILLATPIWWLVTRPDAEAGKVPSTGSAPVEAPVLSRSGILPLSKVAVRSGRLSDQPLSTNEGAPARLRIEALGVDARVVPVGVEPSGGMEVPDDVSTAGWYRFGALPGARGSAMLIGHVDSRVQGPGIFFGLSKLDIGERVRVELSGGSTQSFEVVARRLIAKDELPLDLFARDGPPRLTLVTCGGGFNERSRSYSHNVVVYAVPEGTA